MTQTKPDESADAVGQPLRCGPAELLQRHLAGDETAFMDLVQQYRAPVYSYLARTGVPIEDRDDLFQEAFVRLHRAAPTYDPGRPFHPWMFTIVANLVRNHHRRQRVRAIVTAEPAGREPRSEAADGERQAAARQSVALVAEKLAELPLVRREVVLLHCVEGLSLKDVAEALGVPLGTVKTHLRRARHALVKAVVGAGSSEVMS